MWELVNEADGGAEDLRHVNNGVRPRCWLQDLCHHETEDRDATIHSGADNEDHAMDNGFAAELQALQSLGDILADKLIECIQVRGVPLIRADEFIECAKCCDVTLIRAYEPIECIECHGVPLTLVLADELIECIECRGVPLIPADELVECSEWGGVLLICADERIQRVECLDVLLIRAEVLMECVECLGVPLIRADERIECVECRDVPLIGAEVLIECVECLSVLLTVRAPPLADLTEYVPLVFRLKSRRQFHIEVFQLLSHGEALLLSGFEDTSVEAVAEARSDHHRRHKNGHDDEPDGPVGTGVHIYD
mmetsp:Transcript_756/g.1806  ORF Transcript_756/g.1806 Transcript_756/m.1806 type:complete len:310 (+) Transcript_756:527-1456(+)